MLVWKLEMADYGPACCQITFSAGNKHMMNMAPALTYSQIYLKYVDSLTMAIYSIQTNRILKQWWYRPNCWLNNRLYFVSNQIWQQDVKQPTTNQTEKKYRILSAISITVLVHLITHERRFLSEMLSTVDNSTSSALYSVKTLTLTTPSSISLHCVHGVHRDSPLCLPIPTELIK